MASTLGLVVGGLAVTFVFLSALLRLTQDAKEPPAIKTSIPFISPLFGFVLGMQNFLLALRDEHQLPIYTLRLPTQRIYVVNSLALIRLIERQIKTIAFKPIQAQAAAAVMGVGPVGNAIIGSEKMFEQDSYLATFVPSIHPGLLPGLGVDAMIGTAVRLLSDSLTNCSRHGIKKINLFSWVRDELFMASTEAMYGPMNPFRDKFLVQAWYDFEPSIMVHMLQAWPGLMARRSLHAREHLLIPAFEKYYAENGHHQGSLLAKCQYEHNVGHGLSGRDVAATDIGHMIASLTNSVSSVFWMVYHVFSDREVVAQCREEIEKWVSEDDNGVSHIDLAHVKTSCPVLLSTWQEVLRCTHIGIAARVVMEDVLLDGRYLLKKGATVMTAASVQHTDESAWGPTVRTFNHRRFLSDGDTRRKPPAAFRAFGGGTTLCPGRHFASIEIMSFVALLLLRFDMRPLTNDGEWITPRKTSPMTTSIPTPKDEVWVELAPRDERQWHVSFSASSEGVDVVAEDAANDR